LIRAVESTGYHATVSVDLFSHDDDGLVATRGDKQPAAQAV